jgi:hypothetical protein
MCISKESVEDNGRSLKRHIGKLTATASVINTQARPWPRVCKERTHSRTAAQEPDRLH